MVNPNCNLLISYRHMHVYLSILPRRLWGHSLLSVLNLAEYRAAAESGVKSIEGDGNDNDQCQ